MDYIFKQNDNTPKALLDHFNDCISTGRYNIGCSLVFNHITVKFRRKETDLYMAQNLIKEFLHWLNEDFSHEMVGKEKRLYKDVTHGTSFAVIGGAENKEGNVHVHLLMRVPNGAVINAAFEEKMKKFWRQLTGSGTLKFSRYDAKKETVVNQQTIPTRTGTAELQDDIKPVNEGWSNYIAKTFTRIDGKYSNGWDFIEETNGY